MREIVEKLEEATGSKYSRKLGDSLVKSMQQRSREMAGDVDREKMFMDTVAILLAEISGILKSSGGPYGRVASKVASASNELTDIAMKA